MKIVLEIKDIEKAKTVINFLNQNPYIKIKDIENIKKKKKHSIWARCSDYGKKELLQKKKSGKRRGVIKVLLCDTDVMIEFFKGIVSTKNILENDILPENIVLSSITVMKLYFGAKSKKELILIKKFLSAFEILKLNEEITDLSLNLIEIYSKSHSLKIPDALIGATSLYYKITLFTYNKKDFNFIKELKLY